MSVVDVPFEIHLLRVVKGDAITVRFEKPSGGYYVTVIDGGDDYDVGVLTKHLTNDYKTDTIDLMVCTHWHGDHICGLTKLVGENRFKINEVWVHDPERYGVWMRGNPEIGDQPARGGFDAGVGFKNVDDGRYFLKELEAKGVEHKEPFAGELSNEYFEVIGPDRAYYDEQMRKLEKDFREAGIPFKAVAEKERYDPESIDSAGDDTIGYNNSGAILKMTTPLGVFLFTADAGRKAITRALDASGTEKVFWLKVPHHGGKHNLSRELVERMSPVYACISAQGEPDEKHPCENIVGALRRFGGAKVYSTSRDETISQFFKPQGASEPGEEIWPDLR
jgi:beta-lactamase superfamily II metal-dependent hydrolase